MYSDIADGQVEIGRVFIFENLGVRDHACKDRPNISGNTSLNIAIMLIPREHSVTCQFCWWGRWKEDVSETPW